MSSVFLEFSQSNLVYKPGDKIQGIVKIFNETNFKINYLKIRLRGKSYTGWYEAARKSYVQSEEYYVDNSLLLWSEDNLSSSSLLNAGTHNFPFELEIPNNAPCSFEGSLGWIRYSIYVIADFPNRFDKEKKVLVTVLPKADLNLDPRAKVSPHLELKEGIGFLSTKFVTINASINKGGYVPGEPLDVILDVDNASDRDISEIKIVLEEKASFTGAVLGSVHRRVEKRAAGRAVEDFVIKSKRRLVVVETYQVLSLLVSARYCGWVENRKSQRVWKGKLKVPSLPPSDLPGCSIIDLQYRLLFKLKCGTFNKISFKMPFVIGTIPLKDDDAAPELVDEPPSYMECVFGTVDGIEDEREELIHDDYSPMYGYYNWPES